MSGLSPLARLVLVMICLSLSGSIAAAVHYSAVDLPAQKSGAVPDNGNIPSRLKCSTCLDNCGGEQDYLDCLTECRLIC